MLLTAIHLALVMYKWNQLFEFYTQQHRFIVINSLAALSDSEPGSELATGRDKLKQLH